MMLADTQTDDFKRHSPILILVVSFIITIIIATIIQYHINHVWKKKKRISNYVLLRTSVS
jgi:hypothetical protein